MNKQQAKKKQIETSRGHVRPHEQTKNEQGFVYEHRGRKFIYIVKRDIEKLQNILWYHKIVYGILVFFGLTLIWYGFWKIIELVPILNFPGVAIVVGIAVLVFTGSLYKLWS